MRDTSRGFYNVCHLFFAVCQQEGHTSPVTSDSISHEAFYRYQVMPLVFFLGATAGHHSALRIYISSVYFWSMKPMCERDQSVNGGQTNEIISV